MKSAKEIVVKDLNSLFQMGAQFLLRLRAQFFYCGQGAQFFNVALELNF